MIYFVDCPEANAIKIGHTRGHGSGIAHTRVSSMQSNCPLPLKLLAAIDGDLEYERQLHSQFSDDWIRGEWFKATDTLRAFIAQFPSAPPPPRQGDPRYNRRPTRFKTHGRFASLFSCRRKGGCVSPARNFKGVLTL